MKCVRLAKLLENAQVAQVSSDALLRSLSACSISTDSRSLKRGEIFVALPGEKYDGHRFIPDAVGRGASCIIYNSNIFTPKQYIRKKDGVLWVAVRDTRKGLGKIAENYLGSFSPYKIAITGSAGKTSTKMLINCVLSRRYRTVCSEKSFNNDIGVPKTVLNVDENTEVLIQEMGTNHPGEISYLSNIVHQDHAVITNIGPAHIGFFGSMDRIAEEKKCVLSPLGRDGTAFLNAEDEYFSFLKENIFAEVKTFGLSRGDLFPDRIIDIGVDHTEFIIAGERVRAGVIGAHGILNAVAAALIGLKFGMSSREVKKGIEHYTEEGGRGNVFSWRGITMIDESYNANPLSVSASLQHVGGLTSSGKKVFVLGDMRELGEQAEHYHRALAPQVYESGISVLFSYGSLARLTSEAMKEFEGLDIQHFEEKGDLIVALKNILKNGDIVLIKGSRAMHLEDVIKGLVEA
jgi:UDP-N-acetylmuramoyl-tripeptide--D-alanyl-D-alanine ligase